MKTSKYKNSIDAFLEGKESFSAREMALACPDVPLTSIYAAIRGLESKGIIHSVGKGVYSTIPKLRYSPAITKAMRKAHAILLNNCVGVSSCVSSEGENTVVFVARSDFQKVRDALNANGKEVITRKEASAFPAKLEGYVILDTLTSDAPIFIEEGITVPSIEKEMVDILCSRKKDIEEKRKLFQRFFEQYSINRNRLARYAARRGVKEELENILARLDTKRIEMFGKVQSYLSTVPITKAWVFGSFARGEETPESDLDLLVDLDKDARVSLLKLIRFKLDIEEKIHREVDLIENGALRPFAVESANRDKYLIYER